MAGYNKQPLTLEEQVCSLKDKGIKIEDEEAAKRFLTFVSYFRFSEYLTVFYTNNDEQERICNDISFKSVVDLYLFDSRLRALIWEALEKIEIGVRTVMINYLALEYGAFWFLDHYVFDEKDVFSHCTHVKELNGSIEKAGRVDFIKEHRSKYTKPAVNLPDTAIKACMPPSWIMGETVTFAEWLHVFDNIRIKDRKKIADQFNFQYEEMKSWLTSLHVLRNKCAHHAIIWNKKIISCKPARPKNTKHAKRILDKANGISSTLGKWRPELLYTRLRIIKLFLNSIEPDSDWVDSLITLISEYEKEFPLQNLSRYMLFPEEWKNDPFWMELPSSQTSSSAIP